MSTMLLEPYVKHIPTMAGGVGYTQVKKFYEHHPVGLAPKDFRLTLVNRTIGENSLVDELVFTFTHTCEIDWMMPDISPSHCPVEVAVVVIVGFSEGKITHRHIYWDQASVLAQIGKLERAIYPSQVQLLHESFWTRAFQATDYF